MATSRHTPGRLLGRGLIRLYQWTLSPFIGRTCRYLPTCSEYADVAIARFGFWPGVFMAAARLQRCHPWGAAGYDPVPDALPAAYRWWAPWRAGHWTGAHMPPAARWE